MENWNDKLTDELLYLRQEYRLKKDYSTADEIRNVLDSRGVITYDHKDGGEEVYYIFKGDRKQLDGALKKAKQSISRFSAWLYTQLADRYPNKEDFDEKFGDLFKLQLSDVKL